MNSEHVAWLRDWSVKLVLELRPPFSDFIWSASGWLVADRVRMTFEANKVRGVKFVDAECWHTSRDGTQPLKYWEIACTGWGGLPNPASGVVLRDHCPACGMSWFTPITSGEGLFDEGSWDGSDYFRIYPGGEFVTDRFKELVESERFTGIRFETMKHYIESDLKHPVRRNPRVAGLRHLYSKEEVHGLKGAMDVW
ncbi:MAG: hypothetical protein KF696_07555 [Planctomycetes bacterium]|nr:hypothetical protein [Planctomycetota bacterium]MCW8135407.1 hypothetical protein [Planctomycetota bacterium]